MQISSLSLYVLIFSLINFMVFCLLKRLFLQSVIGSEYLPFIKSLFKRVGASIQTLHCLHKEEPNFDDRFRSERS